MSRKMRNKMTSWSVSRGKQYTRMKTGPQGESGGQGGQGSAGPQGLAGSTGNVGPTGPAGTNGADGATGPTGATSPTGPSGTTGYQQTLQNYTGSDLVWTYPVAYTSGIVPIIEAIASSSGTALLHTQIVGSSTNTSVTIRVNQIASATVSLTGLLSLTLFQQAPTGVKLHITSRNP